MTPNRNAPRIQRFDLLADMIITDYKVSAPKNEIGNTQHRLVMYGKYKATLVEENLDRDLGHVCTIRWTDGNLTKSGTVLRKQIKRL